MAEADILYPSYRAAWWQSGWAMLALVILLQAGRFATFYSLEGHVDLSFQVHAAANLKAGNAYTLTEIPEANLQELTYKPLVGWPPGYSLLALPVQALGGDWIATTRVIRGLSLLWVILAGAWIWQRIAGARLRSSFGWWLALLYGLNFAPFYYPEVTGLICLGLLMLALGFWLTAQEKTRPLPWILLASAAVGLTPWFRFAYLPLLAILPLSMLWLSGGNVLWRRVLRKQSEGDFESVWFWRAVLSGLTEALLFLPLYLHQRSQTGALSHLAYRPQAERLDLGKLLHADAFPVKAFIYADPSVVSSRYGEVLGWIAGLGFLVCSLAVLFVVMRKLWEKPDALRVPGFLLLVLPVVMLVYLSLRYPYEGVLDGGVWTYVQETRYYLPAMLVIHLVFLTFLSGKGKLKRLILIGLVLLVGMRYVARMYQHYGMGITNQTPQSEFDTRLRELVRLGKEMPWQPYYVFDQEEGGWREEVHHYLAAYRILPVRYEALRDKPLQTTKPVSLILHLKPGQKQVLQQQYPDWSFSLKNPRGNRQVWVVQINPG